MATKPPFHADHVGSLLRPPELIEAHTANLQGRLPPQQLRALEDAAIADATFAGKLPASGANMICWNGTWPPRS